MSAEDATQEALGRVRQRVRALTYDADEFSWDVIEAVRLDILRIIEQEEAHLAARVEAKRRGRKKQS